MSKVLKVIKPFFVLDKDDTLELSQDGTTYSSVYKEQTSQSDDASSNIQSTYTSEYTISVDYAKLLIEEGYLEEVKKSEPVVDKRDFVNVFEEIDMLIEDYTEALNNIDDEMANMPACLKVERKTVLDNLITLLTHLKSLKK
jgi:hypothetical protein